MKVSGRTISFLSTGPRGSILRLIFVSDSGEGHFDDGNKASGAATPVEAAPASKKKAKTSKKAKTAKQRLAIADGEVD